MVKMAVNVFAIIYKMLISTTESKLKKKKDKSQFLPATNKLNKANYEI